MISFKTNFIAKSASILLLAFGLLFILIFSFAAPAKAQFNPEINYQGKLTDTLGVSVPDGDYHMRFWLLEDDVIATTSALWTEVRTTGDLVEVENGLFSVMLGDVTPLTGIDFNQSLYLGVEIGGSDISPAWDGEMSPRKILGAVPAAFVAEIAQTALFAETASTSATATVALSADTFAGLATSSFLRSDQDGTLSATSSGALLSLIQNGGGNVLDLFQGTDRILAVYGNKLDLGATTSIAFGGVNYFRTSNNGSSTSVFIGDQAGLNSNIGTGNNMIGVAAGWSNGGSYNNLIGGSAGMLGSGQYNNLFGSAAGYMNRGSYNNSIGGSAGYRNSGSYNETIGYQTGLYISSSNSVFIGAEAFRGTANFSAVNNVALGYQAGTNAQTGASNNILLGYRAADNLTTGTNNIVIGYDVDLQSASQSNTLNIGNLLFGTGINGTGTTLSSGNIGIGTSTPSHKLTVAGDVNLTGALRINGTQAVYIPGGSFTGTMVVGNGGRDLSYVSGDDGKNNTFVGLGVGASTTTGYGNSATGFSSLTKNTTGFYNSAYGMYALAKNTTGSYNTANGLMSLMENTTGSYNTAYGSSGLRYNTTGSYNTVSGNSALISNVSGSNNTVSGSSALLNNITGSYNTVSGVEAGQGVNSSSNISGNTLFGYQSGHTLLTGADYNTLLGSAAGYNITTGANNIFIGASTTAASTTASYQLNIGNTIFGNLALGNIGIGTTTPSHKFTVAGDINFTGNLYKNGVPLALGSTDFVGLSDVSIASLTANRIPFTNAAGTALTDSANFGFDGVGNKLELGGNTTIALDGVNLLAASSTNSNISIGFYTSSGRVSPGSNNFLVGGSNLFGGNPTWNSVINTDVTLGGSFNNVMGKYAGILNSGSYNNLFGSEAGYVNSGNNNNFFGYKAGTRNTGSNNTFMGVVSGGGQRLFGDGGNSGSFNEMIGSQAGGYLNASATVAIGSNSLRGTSAFSAVNNVAIGYQAGMNAGTGANNNILLGYRAANNLTTGANNIVIGYNVDLRSASQSNTLNIGNLLFGTGVNGVGTTLSSGNIGIGTSTPRSRLAVAGTGVTTSGVVGLDQYFTLANATNGAVQLISQLEAKVQATATSTVVGGVWKLEDSTTFGNVVRGLEIQTDRGNNTLGENTALVGYARTFGVKGVTSGDAGALYEPAGVFAETSGAAQGNALRAYSKSITSAALVKFFQDTSTFTGTGLLMSFGNGGGSFSATSSKFIDLQNTGASVFVVDSNGAVTIGDGTTNNNAGLQIGYGGICVDNDGSCVASTTGLISAVAYHTGNSDLAETYFSNENLLTGEVVYAKGGLSVGRASGETNNLVLGVVSTKPGLLLGADDSSLQSGEAKYPIALTGRVPVRLSTENGDIKAGDELMLSSIPGVVMKASSTGFIVGRALEDFDGSRAYSDTYINQFGDDLVDPVFSPMNQDDDPRLDDGCYFGGGRATGEEECVPLASTSTADRVAEANALAERDAEVRALRDLRYQSGEKQRLNNGDVVRVGQIVMFVDTRYRYVDEAGMAAVQALLVRAEGGMVEETIWQRLVNLANNFVDGVLKVFTIQTERVETKELCVDGVCVDADDLRRLLGQEVGVPAGTGVDDNSGGGAGAPTLPPVTGEEDGIEDEQKNGNGEENEAVGTGGENNEGSEEGNGGNVEEEINNSEDGNDEEETERNNDEIGSDRVGDDTAGAPTETSGNSGDPTGAPALPPPAE